MPRFLRHFANTSGSRDHRLVGVDGAYDSGYYDIVRFFGPDAVRPQQVVMDYLPGRFRFTDALIRDFAGEMEKAGRRVLEARTTHRAHMKTAGNDRPQPVISRDGDVESGGQVDLDRELVALAETKLQFSLAARLAALRISSLRASIRGGR